MTFDDDDCYKLFLIVDSYARIHGGMNEMVNAMREQLLPVYRAWHAANPHRIHSICLEAAPNVGNYIDAHTED